MQADEERVLAEAFARYRDRYPDLDIVRQVEHCPPARALVEAWGSGGFRDLPLGSVTHTVVHHAHCPVAVVH